MPRPPSSIGRHLAFVLLAAALSPALAADPDAATAAEPAADATIAAEPAATPALPSAMVMARDQTTGELRPPTAEEMEALSGGFSRALQSLNFSDEGLEQVELPDGTVMIDLQGRFMSTSVAVRTADGRLLRQCSDHPGFILDHADHASSAREVRDER